MEHTEKCLMEQNEILDAIFEFHRKYPKYCTDCNAIGGHLGYEDVAGDGGPRMPVFEACEKCLGVGACPLCGEVVFGADTDDYSKCPKCEWTENDGPFAPERVDQCDCFEQEKYEFNVSGEFLYCDSAPNADEGRRHELTIKIQQALTRLPRCVRDAIIEDMQAQAFDDKQEDNSSFLSNMRADAEKFERGFGYRE